jgi:phage gp36-like protein
MAYCTREDLETRLGPAEVMRLGDQDQDGAEDPDAVAKALVDIGALISGRIAQRWPAYVGQASDVLTPIAVDLVVDRLAVGSLSTEDIRRRADRARADLAAIGKGDMVPSSAELPSAGQGAGEVSFEPGRREFSGGGY